MAKVFHTPDPQPEVIETPKVDTVKIREIINKAEEGYLSPPEIQGLLDAAEIPRAFEAVSSTLSEAKDIAKQAGFPIAMKVVGPLHKSDVGGVALNIEDVIQLKVEFERMIKIPETTGVLIQPMLSGTELFVGVKREEKFGHLVFCGMGGIFIEVLKDVQSALAPVSKEEAFDMITRLKTKKILEGVRGQKGIDIDKYVEIITRVSALVVAAPEIVEMDLNPLLGSEDKIIAVDARINILKNN